MTDLPFFAELFLLVLVIVLVYFIFKLPTKRLLLVLKLKRICKKQGYDITVNHVFRSMIKREDIPDIVIKTDDGGYRVFILTTRFKNSRYHFPNNERFEIFRKGSDYVVRSRRPEFIRGEERTSTFLYEFFQRRNKVFDMSDDGSGYKNILLVHPMPLEVTVAKNTELVHMWDGDEIFKDVIFHSGLGFRNVLNKLPPKYGKKEDIE